MAATDELTSTYRRQMIALRAGTIRDLVRLWPILDLRDIERTYPAWYEAARLLIVRDRGRAAGLASAYLRAHRMAAGVTGDPRIVLASSIDADLMETALRVTTLVGYKVARRAGQQPQQALDTAFVRSTGAVTRLVLDAGRETTTATVAADPKALGWKRVTSGGCDWCAMLASRGAVYKNDTVRFKAHDHCSCSAEPVYDRAAMPKRAPVGTKKTQAKAAKARTGDETRAEITALERTKAGLEARAAAGEDVSGPLSYQTERLERLRAQLSDLD